MTYKIFGPYILFFITLMLAGCVSATPTSHPTAIPTIRFAATFTPSATYTITLTPTPSITPTETITPTASMTFTLMPTATLDLTEAAFATYHAPTMQAEGTSVPLTQQAVSTINAAFPNACGDQYPHVSPDGNWLTDDCGEFQVLSRDGKKKIVIPHDEFALPDLPAVDRVFPKSWSKDSQYLYFAARFCCIDSDVSGLEGPLYRLDLRSSKWEKFIGDGFGNDYSFSPTGRRLLHIPSGGNPLKFHIVDLQTNAEQWLELQNFRDTWDIQWSPDGRHFAVTAKNGSIITEDAQYALFVVSLDDLSITQLISLSDHEVYATAWSKDDVLTITDCHIDEVGHEICKSYPYDLKALPSFKP